jgi:hypothetical protein
MPGDRKTLPQQLGGLARLELTTSVSISAGRLTWIGRLQPTPVSVAYVMRITYAAGEPAPDVRIISPAIHAPEGDALPHVYPGERLCLCYPGQWNDGKMISRTVVPWAAEWLLHYEIWAFTGRWHGGGHESPNPYASET